MPDVEDEWPSSDTVVGTEAHAGEYVLGPVIGAGGMGKVYLGVGPNTGRKVAIKLMHRAGIGWAMKERFAREARALAELRHPAIVEYIDRGTTADGRAFLVMEWLEGEDLQTRLKRGPLAVGDCIGLAVRLADALSLAHERGVVHRDIKPSNIFLPGGSLAEAKILDFGVAHVRHAGQPLTRTGSMIGTVGFMAPEQVRGDPDLDGRADLYSLGCVLHECLTGMPLFSGEHPMAVLAKILLEEPFPVRGVRDDVPEELDAVIAALLMKDRDDRPRNAAALMARLVAIPVVAEHAVVADPTTGRGVTLREQRVCSLLLIRLRTSTIDPLAGTVSDSEDLRSALGRIAAGYSAEFSPMIGGYALVSLRLDAPASDVALQVARCARAIQTMHPTMVQMLLTGRMERQGASYLGRVLDDALALEEATHAGGIFVDAKTAELIAHRFTLEHGEHGIRLGEEREGLAVRLLLNRPTPFVGRVRELAWLCGLVREAIDESRSCAAIITAGPGAGKSRLCYELMHALQGEGVETLQLMARCEPMTQGAALGALRNVLRREIGVTDGETSAQQQVRLGRRIRESGVPDATRVVAFLGELCGLDYPDDVHPMLSHARRDPIIMADAMRLAWIDWLRAECAQRPVLLALEDLHWGDAASVSFVEAALAALVEVPFVVVALARSELDGQFPRLWSSCRVTRMELQPLSARAGVTLVHQMLGKVVGDTVINDLVARADGNPFFLEELIRGAAMGVAGALPDTVLGVLQARLRKIDDESRRFLRAASVFGGGFSDGALAAVLLLPREEVRIRVITLIHSELLSRDLGSESATYRFRHALLRDACYAMLPDDERALAHRLAAEWLAVQETRESIVVAEHYRRAGALESALPWYREAAGEALEGGDFAATVERVEQAILCGPDNETLADLRLLQAEARIWAGSLEEAEQWAMVAIDGLRPGGSRWFTAVQKGIYCASVRGDIDAVLARLALAQQQVAEPGAGSGLLLCLCEAIYGINVAGRAERMKALVAQLEEQCERVEVPPLVLGHVYRVRALSAGRMDLAVEFATRAAKHFEALGDLRNAARNAFMVGQGWFMLGMSSLAERHLRDARALARRAGSEQALDYSEAPLGDLLLRNGQLAEAREVLSKALDRATARRDPRAEGALRVSMGQLSLAEESPEVARVFIHQGLELLARQPAMAVWGMCALARVYLVEGRDDAAVALAVTAAETMSNLGLFVWHEGFVWWTIVECLAQSDESAYTSSLASGISRLRELSSKIADQGLRRSLLAIPEWRALVEHARGAGLDVEDLLK